MSAGATFEVGVSPPGTNFNLGFPSGAAWVRSAREIFLAHTARSTGHSGRYAFLIPTEIELVTRVLAALRHSGIEPVTDYACHANPSREQLHSISMYGVGIHAQSWGFEARGIFDRQLDCDLPKPAPLIGHDAGCGVRKVQRRKLQIVDPRKIKKADVFEPYVDPLVLGWQLLVVSSRFREVLQGSGMTGFEFLPVAGPTASPHELLLSSGDCASDAPDCFQWVIAGRSKPIPIREFRPVRGPCGVCGRLVGGDEPYHLSQPLSESIFEAGPDVQVCDELNLPDDRRVMCLDGNLFVSSRFVDLCVREKFRGFSSLKGKAPNFVGLYFGEPL